MFIFYQDRNIGDIIHKFSEEKIGKKNILDRKYGHKPAVIIKFKHNGICVLQFWEKVLFSGAFG